MATRSHYYCDIFGNPKDLNVRMLPTYQDVMLCYLFIQNNLKRDNSNKDPAIREILDIVVPKIEKVWQSSSIPTVSSLRICNMIKDFHGRYKKLQKNLKARKETVNLQSKIEFFKTESCKLFDIAACKCDLKNCKCNKAKKVPILERNFLQDQRSFRKMAIGAVDFTTTNKLQCNEERKAKIAARMNPVNSDIIQERDIGNNSTDRRGLNAIENHERGDNESISSSEVIVQVDPSTSYQMRTKLPKLALACDRTGVSDRSAAIIANAVLEDVGLLSKNSPSRTIDRMKVRRAREAQRRSLKNENTTTLLPAIFFDGRKDQTLSSVKQGDVFHRKTISEEHITILKEPGSVYLGHVIPVASSALQIKNALISFIEQNFNKEDLISIGCDGTVVNTGHKNGVIRLMEEELGRPLQWLVCLFHFNELPLRHLVKQLDGETTGPRGFKGKIGQQLVNCESHAVANFQPVKSNLPTMSCRSFHLSTDQQYLLEIVKAIEVGEVSVSLSSRNPGKMSHARWLTTANRILRLYIATETPSENLQILVEYIVKVYAPMWFLIKMKPSCVEGAKHLYKMVELSRFLSRNILEIIDPVVQRNAFFAHPENLLLAMLGDENHTYRELAARRILKARTNRKPGIRVFKTPSINFKAKHYSELIFWHQEEISEPPLTKTMEIDLQNIPMQNSADFLLLPCNTQAVERCVRLVTESSTAVCGLERREGFIQARIKSRTDLPSFEKKADYFAKK